MYGDGCTIGASGDAEVGDDGLYGSSGTGWACIAMIIYWGHSVTRRRGFEIRYSRMGR